VSRNNVAEAIQSLEFYGLKIYKPQSGTFVCDYWSCSNERYDPLYLLGIGRARFKSLVETRILWNLKRKVGSAEKIRRKLKQMEEALEAYTVKV